MSDSVLYPSEEHFKIVGSTVYRWVGNLPDLRLVNGWERMAEAFPETTKASWVLFLDKAIYSYPMPHDGKTRRELEALDMISVWKPERHKGKGYSFQVDDS